jgi:hypothetical protein
MLNRRRPLSLEMMRKLQAGLGPPADVLVQPYPIAQQQRNDAATPITPAGMRRDVAAAG